MSNIILFEQPATSTTKITQLFTHLELFSEGTPPQHTLFILGRMPLSQLAAPQPPPDQLLLIDPPADVRQRFKLAGDIATLFTSAPVETGLPQLQTVAGGVAHVRLGDHFLDIYTQRQSAVVHLPALGVLCGGRFGSDAALPQLAPDSDGQEELDTLRLLARLVKQSRLQLYIPQIGALSTDPTSTLTRLAQDVGYLHNLRRVIPALAQRGDDFNTALSIADSLLPEDRRTALCREIHTRNLRALYDVTAVL